MDNWVPKRLSDIKLYTACYEMKSKIPIVINIWSFMNVEYELKCQLGISHFLKVTLQFRLRHYVSKNPRQQN